VQACDENLFTGCTFQDCGTGSGGMVYDTSAGLSTYSGCHFVGGGTGVPMMVSNSGPGRCVFTGCQFDSPNGGDCMILYGPGHTITGNMFLGIGIGASAKVAGVHFAGASGCIVQGNVFYSASATHAVAVCEDSGTGPNIIGSNTVSGTWGYGPFQTNSGGGSFISPQGGTGAPAVGGNVGDYYLRDDTPGTASQRLYVCTTAGLPGAATWTGIL
jgi:hypothetical protein